MSNGQLNFEVKMKRENGRMMLWQYPTRSELSAILEQAKNINDRYGDLELIKVERPLKIDMGIYGENYEN